MDSDIEQLINTCDLCQHHQKSPDKAPVHPWEWPTKPCQRLHVDYAGQFHKMFLIVIDAHSKWLDPTSGSTSQITIDKLCQIFATHGLPELCVTDNGSAFISEEFSLFLQKNDTKHITSAPNYHPPSNGQAERAVQVFKRGISKMPKGDLHKQLQ